MKLHLLLRTFLWRIGNSHSPDHVIGNSDNPYMLRWWITPRKKWLPGAYLHMIMRSDASFALHDHPWWNVSYVLDGQYVEVTIDKGGCERRVIRKAGDIVFRWATAAHRIEIVDPVTSLFIHGPVTRDWGFHCPKNGWTSFQKVMRGISNHGNDAPERSCE